MARARAKPKTKPRTFAQVLAPYPETVQALAKQTRAMVRELLPDSIETVDGSGPYIGYGSTTGYKGLQGHPRLNVLGAGAYP